MADVLLLCLSEDEVAAQSLAATFERAGLTVDGCDGADAEVAAAPATLILWTPAAARTPAMRAAAARIAKSGKALFAVFPPVKEAPPAGAKAFDLSKWSGDPDDEAIDALFIAVDRLVARARELVFTPSDEISQAQSAGYQSPAQPPSQPGALHGAPGAPPSPYAAGLRPTTRSSSFITSPPRPPQQPASQPQPTPPPQRAEPPPPRFETPRFEQPRFEPPAPEAPRAFAPGVRPVGRPPAPEPRAAIDPPAEWPTQRARTPERSPERPIRAEPRSAEPALDPLAQEAADWRAVRESRDPADLERFLGRYGGGGAFSELAQLRLQRLRAAASRAYDISPNSASLGSPPVGESRTFSRSAAPLDQSYKRAPMFEPRASERAPTPSPAPKGGGGIRAVAFMTVLAVVVGGGAWVYTDGNPAKLLTSPPAPQAAVEEVGDAPMRPVPAEDAAAGVESSSAVRAADAGDRGETSPTFEGGPVLEDTFEPSSNDPNPTPARAGEARPIQASSRSSQVDSSGRDLNAAYVPPPRPVIQPLFTPAPTAAPTTAPAADPAPSESRGAPLFPSQ